MDTFFFRLQLFFSEHQRPSEGDRHEPEICSHFLARGILGARLSMFAALNTAKL